VLLGSLLLLAGKVHFGYIYGFSVLGCMSLHALVGLIGPDGVILDFWITCSILGYCLLPVIGLAGLAVITRLQSLIGTALAGVTVAWATHAATRLFVAKLGHGAADIYFLIAYPVMLLYSSFVLITVF
jgi:hypothetical protein